MKKNIIPAAIAAASAVLLAASCDKQAQPETGKTFTAVIESGLTKTTITDDFKVNWVEGDEIEINGTKFSAAPDPSDATRATFTKVSGTDPDGEYGYTAVYPASITTDEPSLPATQTYAAGKFNAPMCAISDSESLEFKNICGVLCFALTGTDLVESITVSAAEPLCGSFTIIDAETFGFSANEGYALILDCGSGVQLNSSSATNFYIYLPPQTYAAGMKVTITNTDGEVFEKTTVKSVTIERSNLYTFNWTPDFGTSAPDGPLSGKFSVASGRQVQFSRGNLTYDVSTGAWSFFEHQYDYDSSYNADLISLFTWGYNATQSIDPAGKDNDNVFTGPGTLDQSEDWGSRIGDGSMWRTLTQSEWGYLLNSREVNGGTGEGYSYRRATVNANTAGVYGLILYPDDYTIQSSATQYSSSGWASMEELGCVFLPAAGYRNGSTLTNAGSLGEYWSSTGYHGNNASAINFNNSSFSSDYGADRALGRSVRLVTDVE